MGLFNSMTGSGNLANYGGAGITTGGLMQMPQHGITPLNPGNLQNIDMPPVEQKPRMHTMKEADELEKAASIAESGATQAKRAYKFKTRIVAAAAETQVAHRGYAAGVADATAKVTAANVAFGQHLHGLREAYARMGYSTDRAAETAQMRVEQAALKFRGLN